MAGFMPGTGKGVSIESLTGSLRPCSHMPGNYPGRKLYQEGAFDNSCQWKIPCPNKAKESARKLPLKAWIAVQSKSLKVKVKFLCPDTCKWKWRQTISKVGVLIMLFRIDNSPQETNASPGYCSITNPSNELDKLWLSACKFSIQTLHPKANQHSSENQQPGQVDRSLLWFQKSSDIER